MNKILKFGLTQQCDRSFQDKVEGKICKEDSDIASLPILYGEDAPLSINRWNKIQNDLNVRICTPASYIFCPIIQTFCLLVGNLILFKIVTHILENFEYQIW